MSTYLVVEHPDLPPPARGVVPAESLSDWESRGWLALGEAVAVNDTETTEERDARLSSDAAEVARVLNPSKTATKE